MAQEAVGSSPIAHPTECGAVRLAHLLWEQGVGGSNPSTPTLFTSEGKPRFLDGAFSFQLAVYHYSRLVNLNQTLSKYTQIRDTLFRDTPTPIGKAGNRVTSLGHFAQ